MDEARLPRSSARPPEGMDGDGLALSFICSTSCSSRRSCSASLMPSRRRSSHRSSCSVRDNTASLGTRTVRQ